MRTVANKAPLFPFLSDLQGWNLTKRPQLLQLRPSGGEPSVGTVEDPLRAILKGKLYEMLEGTVKRERATPSWISWRLKYERNQ